MIENLPKEIYGDIKNAIISIAEGLKVPIEMVYSTLIKQAYVDSIVNTIVGLIVIISLIISILCAKKFYCNNPNGGACVVMVMASVVIALAFSVMIISGLNDTVTGFINPEYYVMKNIINMIK